MHEMSLALALVDQVEAVLRENGAQSVEIIRLAIGALSGVEEESLRFCAPLAFEGTLLEGARLEIENVPVQIACRTCHARGAPDVVDFRCVNCRGSDVQIVAGREFLLTAIEVE